MGWYYLVKKLLNIVVSIKIGLDPTGPWTTQLTTSDPNGKDGWFVEWIKIYAGDWRYDCQMSAFLDNENSDYPNTRKVSCTKF